MQNKKVPMAHVDLWSFQEKVLQIKERIHLFYVKKKDAVWKCLVDQKDDGTMRMQEELQKERFQK